MCEGQRILKREENVSGDCHANTPKCPHHLPSTYSHCSEQSASLHRRMCRKLCGGWPRSSQRLPQRGSLAAQETGNLKAERYGKCFPGLAFKTTFRKGNPFTHHTWSPRERPAAHRPACRGRRTQAQRSPPQPAGSGPGTGAWPRPRLLARPCRESPSGSWPLCRLAFSWARLS